LLIEAQKKRQDQYTDYMIRRITVNGYLLTMSLTGYQKVNGYHIC